MTAASEEVVEIKGDKRSEEAGINDELSGGYNIPFTGKDMKYLERKQGAELVFGLPGNFFISPEVTLSADYREESFSDYDEAIVSTNTNSFQIRGDTFFKKCKTVSGKLFSRGYSKRRGCTL
jgi:hypothetical protein